MEAHLAEPAGTAAQRGRKKRAKTDRTDARHLRELLSIGRLPESWVPPSHVLEVRTPGRLYVELMDERRGRQQRLHAQLSHQGVPPIRGLLTGEGRKALAEAELSPAGRQMADTALDAAAAKSASSRWRASWPGAVTTPFASSVTKHWRRSRRRPSTRRPDRQWEVRGPSRFN